MSQLVKRSITDKNGRRTHVWVQPKTLHHDGIKKQERDAVAWKMKVKAFKETINKVNWTEGDRVYIDKFLKEMDKEYNRKNHIFRLMLEHRQAGNFVKANELCDTVL